VKIPIFGSELLRYEAGNTPKQSKRDSAAGTQRDSLIAESEALELVPNEKKLLGFSHSSDRYGGWFVCPLISDVQTSRFAMR
jgi:hypothetical protein